MEKKDRNTWNNANTKNIDQLQFMISQNFSEKNRYFFDWTNFEAIPRLETWN